MSKFATDNMFMGEDRTPITIPDGYDGLTKAFFANVVPCKSMSHGCAETALASNVLSTGHQNVKQQSDQEPSIIDVNHKAGTHIPNEIVYEESPVGDSNSNRNVRNAARGTNDTPSRRRRDDGGKPSTQQIAAFGEQTLFKTHKT